MRDTRRPPRGAFLHFGVRRWVVDRPFVGAGVALAVFEPVAVAVHLEDVNVMGERSSSAPVRRSEAKMPVHSSKGRLLVTIVEPRS